MLDMFCQAILAQLNRINDEKQRETYDLPFDPYCPDCEPYAYMTDPNGPVGSDGRSTGGVLRTNIVQRVVDLLDVCPYCSVDEQ